MKARNLLELSEFADQVLMGLVETAHPVSEARFGEQPNEAMANYLANVKAGVQNAVESLSSLARRCHAAELLWSMHEAQQAGYERIIQQNVQLAKLLSEMPLVPDESVPDETGAGTGASASTTAGTPDVVVHGFSNVGDTSNKSEDDNGDA